MGGVFSPKTFTDHILEVKKDWASPPQGSSSRCVPWAAQQSTLLLEGTKQQLQGVGKYMVTSHPQRWKNISGNWYALKSCFNRGIKVTDSVIQLWVLGNTLWTHHTHLQPKLNLVGEGRGWFEHSLLAGAHSEIPLNTKPNLTITSIGSMPQLSTYSQWKLH